MDSPLAELYAWWDAAAPEDGNASTSLTAFQTLGEGYRLDFETVDDANARAKWRLDLGEVQEAVWRNEYGDPAWFEDHILLSPHRSGGALISFAKPLKDPLRAWGAVARAHRALAREWFPLERFFRTDLLEARFGQLGSGPAVLLASYADALRTLNEEIGYASHDQLWRAKDPAPTVLTWGKSYFVASSFCLVRTG